MKKSDELLDTPAAAAVGTGAASSPSPLTVLPDEILQNHLLDVLFKTGDKKSLSALRASCRKMRDTVDGKDLHDFNARYSSIKQLAATAVTSMVLLDNGRLFVWGDNRFGALGLGNFLNRNRPQEMRYQFPHPVTEIVAGMSHVLAKLENNQICAWGDNHQGQLGLNDLEEIKCSPEALLFDFPAQIKQLAAGSTSSFAHLENGELYAWGDNSHGQLGLGDVENRICPQKLAFAFPAPIKKVVSGAGHTVALLENDEIFAWGWNEFGQLGLGDLRDQLTPQSLPFAFPASIKDVFADGGHTKVWLENDEIYTWGFNEQGQLGIGNTRNQNTPVKMDFQFPAPINKLVVGGMNSIALLDNGEIFSWGENFAGLRPSADSAVSTPEKNRFYFTAPVKQMISIGARRMVLFENDDIFQWGWDLSSLRDETRRNIQDTPTPFCFDFVEKPLLEKTFTSVYDAYRADTSNTEAPSTEAKDIPAAAAAAAARNSASRLALRHSW